VAEKNVECLDLTPTLANAFSEEEIRGWLADYEASVVRVRETAA
jgi:hypothetical protein